MYQRPLLPTVFLLLLAFTGVHPMEPTNQQPGLLDLPDDMLAKIIIHTSLNDDTQFSPESLIPYVRNKHESSCLDYFTTTGKTSYTDIITELNARSRLALALKQIQPFLSTSRSTRALMLNPTIAKAVLNHFNANHQIPPVYIATQLHQARLIPIIENDQHGLAYWYDKRKLKRNFRGQLREAVTMILADTHDANRLKKATWLIDQKPHEFSPEGFTLMLNSLIWGYKVENDESAYFILDKEPAFEAVILPKFIKRSKWHTDIASYIINRFPKAKSQLSTEEQMSL